MKKINSYFIGGVAFICYIAGMIVSDYGKPIHDPNEPPTIVDAWTCIGVIGVFMFCLFMGYMAGRQDYKNDAE